MTPGTSAGVFLPAQVAPSSPAASGVGGNREGAHHRPALQRAPTGALPPPTVVSPGGRSGREALPSLLSAVIYSLIGKASHVVNISNLAPPPIKK